MTINIKDIAKKAGVSYATVSRALNNRPGVNEKTRRDIQKLAEEMGYKPNALARGLVTRESRTLGLVIPDITNPFFPEVARGVEDAASRSGYNVFLCNTNWDAGKENTYVEVLEEKRIDGLVLASVTDDGKTLEGFIRRGTPLVLVNRVLKDIDTHYVIIDNIKGGCMVVEYLLELGHTRIAFIGGLPHVEATRERLQGYRLAMSTAGMPVDEELILYDSFKKESGYQNTMRLLAIDPRPTAIFAANDVLALGVIQAIQDAGLRVPDDIAVIGFDDITFASYAEIGLTTIAQPKYVMGEMAAKILIEDIKEGDTGEKKHVVLQPRLVVRKSSGSPKK